MGRKPQTNPNPLAINRGLAGQQRSSRLHVPLMSDTSRIGAVRELPPFDTARSAALVTARKPPLFFLELGYIRTDEQESHQAGFGVISSDDVT